MTKQISDTLLYEGRKIPLNRFYLEPYFKLFPEKKLPQLANTFTACWRGYSATLKIENNDLIVVDAISYSDEALDMAFWLDQTFPEQRKFSWFSGLIRIDTFKGEYDDAEPEDGVFEYLEIRKGRLLAKRSMNYAELQLFKELHFSHYKSTPEYAEQLMSWKSRNPGMSDEKIDAILLSNILLFMHEVLV